MTAPCACVRPAFGCARFVFDYTVSRTWLLCFNVNAGVCLTSLCMCFSHLLGMCLPVSGTWLLCFVHTDVCASVCPRLTHMVALFRCECASLPRVTVHTIAPCVRCWHMPASSRVHGCFVSMWMCEFVSRHFAYDCPLRSLQSWVRLHPSWHMTAPSRAHGCFVSCTRMYCASDCVSPLCLMLCTDGVTVYACAHSCFPRWNPHLAPCRERALYPQPSHMNDVSSVVQLSNHVFAESLEVKPFK